MFFWLDQLHIVETIAFLLKNYLLTVKIHIVNHLEHFVHILSIEPTDLHGL